MRSLPYFCFALTVLSTPPLYAAECRGSGGNDWVEQSRACPESAVAAYNATLQQLQQGDWVAAQSRLQQALQQHPDFAPLRQLQSQFDPQLIKLQQQQAELERKRQLALQQQQVAQQRQQLEAENRRLEQQLAQLGVNEYQGMEMKTQWQFPAARQPDPDTLVVVIGNRQYGKGIPAIPYAHNDAQAFRAFAQTTLGVEPENIFYEEDASKGEMEGIFQSTLPARVKRGQSRVWVYFSGHGLAADGDAMLLPADARPNTAQVTGYSRQKLLQQLAALEAREVALFLDACYSGTDKSGTALLEGKPVFTPPQLEPLPNHTLLVTAATSTQIAWMDSNKGHSLMTYWLLQGLSGQADSNGDRTIDSGELKTYLQQQVNRAALQLHEQAQQPEVRGRDAEAVLARF